VQRWRQTTPLVRMFTIREFKTRYRQSALDIVWSLINPIVVMAVYGVVLHSAFHANGEGVPYLSFAWAGLIVWTFFSGSLSQAMPSLISASDLLTKVYFPRESLPLAMVGVGLVDLVIGIATVLIVALIQGIDIRADAIAVVVPLGVLVIWTAALAIFGAMLTVFVRDVNHAGQLVLRVGFFATPVMYAPAALPHALRWTASVNPVAVCTEGVRDTLLRHHLPDWQLLGVHGAVAAVVLVAALAYTRSIESRIADLV